ncbi:MAG: hypothetical protein ASARMPRED_005409 [Alectoria sarmentosa]|nr:MAG: hypothetical protein ASARMPRED_005409 [Alectoria sarmentosa]
MRPLTTLSLVLALSGSALGAPAPENDLKIRGVDECKAVTVIISILSQYKASATSFCSSFISVPVKTVTSATAHHDLNAEAFHGDIYHYKHADNFILKLESSVILDGAQLEGTYDQIDDGDAELVGFNGLTDPSAAGVLSLTSTGFLMIDSVGQIAFRIPGQTGLQLLLFDPPAEVEGSDTPVVCSIATGALTCSDGVNSILQLCPGFAVTDDLFIGPVVASGCVGVDLKVLPVCVVP